MRLKSVRKLRRNVRGLTPVISTVILTGVIVTLVAVALAYTNGLVQTNLTQSDFNSAKQFMQTGALNVDDVAWTVGRTGTVLYSSRYGYVQFYPSALNYTLYVKVGSGSYTKFASYLVGIYSFNVLTSYYTYSNGYYEQVYPTSTPTLTLSGTSAPVARVFVIEKVPMPSGSYTRIATVPAIRSLNSTITASGSNVYYMRLYLPVLTQGAAPNKLQSMTFTGSSLSISSISKVTAVNVTVTFPMASQGFDSSFFHFPTLYQVITPPSGYADQVLELYVGSVSVSLGV